MPKPKASTKNPKSSAKRAAAKSRKPVAKHSAVLPAVKRSNSGNRVLQLPPRRWYQAASWKNRPPSPSYKPLPKARQIFVAALEQQYRNWKLFSGIALVYGVLNIVLVRGLSGSGNLASFKANLDSVFHGVGGRLANSGTSFLYLLGTSGSGNTATSGVYQGLLLIIGSLAFIWALRQVTAGHKVRIRDSFYQGMYPLIPFLLLFLIIGVQLLPLAIGGGLYSTVVTGGIAVHAWEKIFWLLLFVGLALWSLRMVTASLVAAYVVTLPDMTPLRALRSAKQLVRGRRLLIWRKLLFLPIVLLLFAALIELPLILFVTVLAPWVFFVFSTAALALVHGYLYNLYREML